MGGGQDYLALDWVKGEIQETLNQSQQALEAFVENPEDSTRMRFCQTYLHQVYGTLQMVEFYGAGLLAEEMERLSQALLDGNVGNVADAQETLMRAILQLPPYLERVQKSRRDLPMVLLPLLNDLRAARGESLMSETALFKPDMVESAGSGEVPGAVKEDPKFPALIRKIRQMYQIALLGVIRGDQLEQNYNYMTKVFSKLEQVSGDAARGPLWKITNALVEGLSRGYIEVGTSIKLVMGHVDRELRELVGDGIESLNRPAPRDLLKNLLYYIAKSEQAGPRMEEIRQRYRLDEALPSDSDIDAERAAMTGPDDAAMQSVVGALSEELTKVKDSLEQFVHNGETDAAKLEPVMLNLKQVGDTIAVLGMGQARQLLLEQLEVLEKMVNGKQAVEREVLNDVAGSLLYVEATLASSSGEGALSGQPDVNHQVSSANEAVIRECRAGLEEAKDGIIEYIASQWDRSHLEPVPAKLVAVRGGLDVVQLSKPAVILRQCVGYIQDKLLVEDASPDWRNMDTLADAITSVEYYLERLSDDPSTDEQILDIARSSVAALGYPISDEEFGSAEAEVEQIDMQDVPVAEDEASQETSVSADTDANDEVAEAPTVEEVGDEGLDTESPLTEAPQLDVPVVEESPEQQVPEAPIIEETAPEVAEPAAQETAPPEEEDSLIDDEIIEIFVEESEEVLEALNEFFPRWAKDQSDEEALVEFRRAFHTLKGSGRMVGATVVGELAWSIENMMNRVIDKTIETTPVLIELVRTVHGLIPELVDAFAKQAPAPYDVQPLMDAADSLAEGGSIDVVPDVRNGGSDGGSPEQAASPETVEDAASESDSESEVLVEDVEIEAAPVAPETDAPDVEEVSFDSVSIPEVSEEVTEPDAEASSVESETEAGESQSVPEAEVDETLLEIYRTEGETNLEIIKAWLAELDRDLSRHQVDDEIHRALHTIKGSARMAEVWAVAKVAEPLEKFVKELINTGSMAGREIISLLDDAVLLLEQGVQAAPLGEDAELPGGQAIIDRVEHLRSGMETEESAGVSPHLVSSFLAEGMDLILDADRILDEWLANPSETGQLASLAKELRTLAQGAEKAGLQETSDLSIALADSYEAVVGGRIQDLEGFSSTAQEAQEALVSMMDYLAAGQTIQAQTTLIEELKGFFDQAGPEDGGGGVTPESGSGEDDRSDEASAGANVDTVSQPQSSVQLSEETDAVEPVLSDMPDTSVASGQPADAAVKGELVAYADLDLDPDLADIFLEEAEEILESAGESLDNWEQSPEEPGDLVQSLQRDLHTLKGGARMAGIAAIGDLGHELENLYEGFNNRQFGASPVLFELLHKCHDRLADMVDAVRAQQDFQSAPELVSAIYGFLADPQGWSPDQVASAPAPATAEPELPVLSEAVAAEAEQEATVDAETSVAEPESKPVETATPAAPPPPPPERDPELVEIFMEEAEEILESAGNSLETWLEDTNNLIEVQSLQRDLHTLKGGARMAEIPELGDLGHELENLYEGLAQSTLKSTPVLFDLLHRCHDRLAEMVEAVQANQGMHPATELIQAIHDYIADPDGFTLDSVSTNAAAPENSGQVAPAPVLNQPASEESKQKTDAITEELPEDFDADIVDIFLEESEELSEALDTQLNQWRDDPSNSAAMDEIKRVLHTLKGGARLAGLKKLGDVSHEFETFLIENDALVKNPDDQVFNKLNGWLDDINSLLEQVKKAITAGAPAAQPPAEQEKPQAATPAPAQPKEPETPPTPQQKQQAAQKQQRQQPQEMVRVGAELLESLVNLAGETSINRGRVEAGISDFASHVEEMGGTIERLYEQLRRLDLETEEQIMSTYKKGIETGEYSEDFDPLEMDQYSELHQITKQLSESASDLMDVKNSLLDRTRDTETLLLQQSRVNTELQEKLMRTRMVPFSRLVPRLRRIVRQVSGELGKKVNFDVLNPEGELDRTLLERVVAPLEHMLRNAVDHGIEGESQDRVNAGKAETGNVTLELGREGGEVVLILQDDGKGIDTDAVRKKAEERGLIEPGAVVPDHEIQQFIFNAGFSTAKAVTQISGRGVGMDVVASEIKQMGGSVTIESEKGKGTRFVVRLPFTVAMNRALMVGVAEDQYAIPLNQIEGIVRISPFELENYLREDADDFTYAGQQYDLEYLGSFVHGVQRPSFEAHSSPLPVLLIRSADHTVAMLVDSLLGSREVVVKSVGPQLSTVAGISGATILGDGSVVIILDIHSLLRAAHVQRQHEARAIEAGEVPVLQEPEQVEPEPEEDRPPVIMVTDDSVTVRKVTGRFLERSGFKVVTAKDGVDAVAQLEDFIPDLMLLDIEMPRMDGFEVATHVRHDERLKGVPIIMITSRMGEKHRERAMDIGVNCYLGKPFQEGELLSNINELLAQQKASVD